MELLGDANWWLPSWLERLLPRIGVEGESSRSLDVLDQEVVTTGAEVPVLEVTS